MLEKFLGNYETVKTLTDWLEGWFHKSTYKPPYAILFSASGNGKTFLVKALAFDMNLDLQTIDADDITSQETMNDAIKRLNLCKFNGQQKIILVENYDEISYKARLFEMWKVSNFPIIYTTTKYPKNDVDFKHAGLFLKLEKPLPSQVARLMEERLQKLGLTLSAATIEKISKESPSVRCALNSCLTSLSNETVQGYVSIYEKIKQLSRRGLRQDILYKSSNDTNEVKKIFNAIQGFDDVSYTVQERFAQLDEVAKRQWKEGIDAFLLNHMREPVEKVEFELEYKKKESKQESKKEEKTEHKKVEPTPSIESFY